MLFSLHEATKMSRSKWRHPEISKFLTRDSTKMFFALQVVSGVCVIYDVWPGVLYSLFRLLVQLIVLILPLIILIFCYGRIVWVLHSRISDKTTDSQSNQADKFELTRKNTIKTFLLVALCFFICWSQNQVYYFMYNLGYKADWDSTYYKNTVIMVFLNCTVNPFIYLIKYQDYQKALRNFIYCGKEGPVLWPV